MPKIPKSQLQTNLASKLASNSRGAITAKVVRDYITDLLDSYTPSVVLADQSSNYQIPNDTPDNTLIRAPLNTAAVTITIPEGNHFQPGFHFYILRDGSNLDHRRTYRCAQVIVTCKILPAGIRPGRKF